jgi:transposase InsO family protein
MSRFDMICEANEIEHRLTKPNHPWTNGQVERMTRPRSATTTTATTNSSDLELFLDAYNPTPGA